MCVKSSTFRDNAIRLRFWCSAADRWPSISSESPLCRILDGLNTNLLQFLVLLGRQNGFHLRICLLMNSPDLFHFLYSCQRIVVLDGVHFWDLGGQNRQDFLLL